MAGPEGPGGASCPGSGVRSTRRGSAPGAQRPAADPTPRSSRGRSGQRRPRRRLDPGSGPAAVALVRSLAPPLTSGHTGLATASARPGPSPQVGPQHGRRLSGLSGSTPSTRPVSQAQRAGHAGSSPSGSASPTDPGLGSAGWASRAAPISSAHGQQLFGPLGSPRARQSSSSSSPSKKSPTSSATSAATMPPTTPAASPAAPAAMAVPMPGPERWPPWWCSS